jgi:hypothetical protein
MEILIAIFIGSALAEFIIALIKKYKETEIETVGEK